MNGSVRCSTHSVVGICTLLRFCLFTITTTIEGVVVMFQILRIISLSIYIPPHVNVCQFSNMYIVYHDPKSENLSPESKKGYSESSQILLTIKSKNGNSTTEGQLEKDSFRIDSKTRKV